jgi:hypothetical protein
MFQPIAPAFAEEVAATPDTPLSEVSSSVATESPASVESVVLDDEGSVSTPDPASAVDIASTDALGGDSALAGALSDSGMDGTLSETVASQFADPALGLIQDAGAPDSLVDADVPGDGSLPVVEFVSGEPSGVDMGTSSEEISATESNGETDSAGPAEPSAPDVATTTVLDSGGEPVADEQATTSDPIGDDPPSSGTDKDSVPPSSVEAPTPASPPEATSSIPVEDPPQPDQLLFDEPSPDDPIYDEIPDIIVESEAELEAARLAQIENDRAARASIAREEIRREVEAEFQKGCVRIDDTGFYCLAQRARTWNGTIAPSDAIAAVSADPDPDGGTDREVFATIGGVQVRVTANDRDDAFPAKDALGGSIVWQEMVDGRWQIMFATIDGGIPAVIPVTNGTESGYHPRVEGGTVIWQAWIDGNWEIVTAKRRDPNNPLNSDVLPPGNALVGAGKDWEVTRLTVNTMHDMFPSIARGIASWQSFEGGVWHVVARDLESGKTLQLSDAAKAEGARLAFVWQEEDEAGDARLVALDLSSGERLDLSEEARRLDGREKRSAIPETPVSSPENGGALLLATSTLKTQKEEGDPTGDDPSLAPLGVGDPLP